MIDPIKRALERVELRRAYKEVFETAQGQRVLAHIMQVGGITNPALTSDPNQLLVNEGRRQLALSIFKEAHGSMDSLTQQLQEQIEKQESAQ